MFQSLHLLSENEYLVVAHQKGDNLPGSENAFVLKKSDETDAIPTEITPIKQDMKFGSNKIEDISNLDPTGLSDFCLKMALKVPYHKSTSLSPYFSVSLSSLSHTLTHTLLHTHTLSLLHIPTLSLTHTLSLSLLLTHTLSFSYTHTHTLSLSL